MVGGKRPLPLASCQDKSRGLISVPKGKAYCAPWVHFPPQYRPAPKSLSGWLICTPLPRQLPGETALRCHLQSRNINTTKDYTLCLPPWESTSSLMILLSHNFLLEAPADQHSLTWLITSFSEIPVGEGIFLRPSVPPVVLQSLHFCPLSQDLMQL